MIYIYYRVTSVDEFRLRAKSYFEIARSHGLLSIMQKKDEPGLFMEIIADSPIVNEQMRDLSGLRAKFGLDKFIRENEIHTEVFETILEAGEG